MNEHLIEEKILSLNAYGMEASLRGLIHFSSSFKPKLTAYSCDIYHADTETYRPILSFNFFLDHLSDPDFYSSPAHLFNIESSICFLRGLLATNKVLLENEHQAEAA